MSKILVFLKPDLSVQQKILVSKITHDSLNAVNTAENSSEPFKEYILFMNDYPEIAQQLNELVKILGNDHVKLFEVDEEHQFTSVSDIENDEIAVETLQNILQSADNYE